MDNKGALVIYTTSDTTIVWFIPEKHALYSGVGNFAGCFLGGDNTDWEENTGMLEDALAEFYQSCVTASEEGGILKLIDGEDNNFHWSAFLTKLEISQVVSCGDA